jgi:hypothetical protein
LWEAAYREAQVQAFADANLVIAACFAISVVMVPFMRGGAAEIGRHGGKRGKDRILPVMR